ncbi:MAG: hypothetical protein HEP71_09055 [Roseivirga sp.]|nr:hypothetical protein [Roseivirga sp.]
MKQTITIWKTAFLFLIISAVIGALMRLQVYDPLIKVNYQYLLHTHSHVVLLGWIFNALIAAVHYMMFREEKGKKYFRLFILFQVSVTGMLLSFPFQGYAAVSITFSTLHILLSYIWAVWTWKKSKALSKTAGAFVRWGLFYLCLSTLGPFSLGPIIATGGTGSDWYYMAIYFYLHFFYNGAVIFILLAMLFWFLDDLKIKYDEALSLASLKLMNISCILGLLLSALWMKPHWVVYVIAGIGGLVQVLAIIPLARLIKPIFQQQLIPVSGPARTLLKVVILAFMLKVVLQAISAVPAIAELASQVRYYTIGYLHLVFIGLVSPFLLAWFNLTGLYPLDSKPKRIGLAVFLIGFIITELIIISQVQLGGSFSYFRALFVASLVLWAGMLLLFPFGKPGSRMAHR